MFPATYTREIALAIAAAGVRFGVEPPHQLVQAIIAVESSFRQPVPEGAAGELGPMQVKPATARALGLTSPALLVQPAVGIMYGTLELARQLARYKGNVADAIAAYNAGTAVRTSGGQYINQGYVDKVARALAGAELGPAASWFAVAGVGAAVLTLLGHRRRRAH